MKLHTLIWTGLLSLLLPLAAQAGDTPAPISVTEGGSRVVALAAGVYHTCGLKADGSVDCWGDDTQGQVDPAAGEQATGTHVGPYLSVSTGGYHTCALKADGAVDCWGRDVEGQVDPAAGEQSTGTHAGPYLSVSAGSVHTCALKANGAVDCWGSNHYLQLDPAAGSQTTATHAGPYLSVSAGLSHSCALKADGAVDCWGSDQYGQVDPADGPQNTSTHAGPYLSVSAGAYHTCGLKADGAVDCWGLDVNGQVDPADGKQVSDTGTHAGPYLSVSAGSYHTCGLKADGAVDCWGYDNYGQVDPAGGSQATGTHAGPYLSVSAGYEHTCGVKADGTVQCWGAGGPGTSGVENYGQSTVPADLGPLGFGQIAAGNAHACEVKRDGTLSCWGLNAEGQATPPAGLFTQVVAGDSHSCAIGTDGKVTCWGRNGADNTLNQLLTEGVWRQLAPGPDGAICALSANNGFEYCLRGEGNDQANGYAGYQFRNITHDLNGGIRAGLCGVSLHYGGNGLCSQGFDATHQGLFAGPWQRLESGLAHQCGLKADGTLACWGDDSDGQTDNVPTGLIRAFSVGYNHACAIRENGTLACWGSDINGQTDAPDGTYIQVAAGNTFTCAIRNDGERVCWGASPGNPSALSNLPNGVVGVAYSQQLTVTGPSAPANPVFVRMSGSLPPGLSLASNGLVSGTPTASGTFNFTIDAEGDSGFAATRAYTVTVIADGTPPVISYTLTPPAPDGSNGWYVGNVGITWSVTDAESGISSSTGCTPSTLNSDTAGATFTCSATSPGGTSSKTTSSIKRDATKPTLAPTVPSPLLRGHSYTASPNASDALSGLASSSCGALDTSSTGDKSTTCMASDKAGNSNTVALNYTVVTTCTNDGYKGAQLTWCQNICENGLTGQVLDTWIHRWIDRYRDLPYCRVGK